MSSLEYIELYEKVKTILESYDEEKQEMYICWVIQNQVPELKEDFRLRLLDIEKLSPYTWMVSEEHHNEEYSPSMLLLEEKEFWSHDDKGTRLHFIDDIIGHLKYKI